MKTILIATNDPEMSGRLISFLSKYYAVTTVARSNETLLALLDADIDLLIIDLNLDGMTGLETIPIIKKTRPKIPIIVISDDESVETGRAVAQEGVFYYALKPFDSEEIQQVTRAALNSTYA